MATQCCIDESNFILGAQGNDHRSVPRQVILSSKIWGDYQHGEENKDRMDHQSDFGSPRLKRKNFLSLGYSQLQPWQKQSPIQCTKRIAAG
ncbi:hypothetical protein Nepgr_016815 [Nepenthes gracilis]|uniref:Uncharacterized protein n=1 Tax=Nepenthes gracilis TaxID=150966 RepID=A0AAD3SQE0_NEPGR|nr:hypothetical protein Nepgr_016815 [Nepenthes gracilis]